MDDILATLQQALRNHQAGHLQQAGSTYRRILACDPENVDAWHLLGMLEHQLGNHISAENHIRHALERKPDFAEAHNNLGNALKAQGRLAESVACFQRAVALSSACAEAHLNLGNFHQSVGSLQEAATCYRRAIDQRPALAEAHCNLGVVLQALHQLDDARDAYQRALELDPNNADACYNLGTLLHDQNKLEEATAWCQRAVALNPSLAEAWYNLGNVLRKREQWADAAAAYRQAIALRPNYVKAYGNLGVALAELRDLTGAIAAYEQALAVDPNNARAIGNLGVALNQAGKVAEATCLLDRAIELDETRVQIRVNRAFAALLQGDWQRGWKEYEWRWKLADFKTRVWERPTWNGESLKDRAILLHAEQGFGDTFQFIRYGPLVQQLGATVIVECQRGLSPILARCPGIDHVVEPGDSLPPFDFHVPLPSLPHSFATRIETIPADVPYLFADPALIDHWRERLSEALASATQWKVSDPSSALQGRLRVGINWQGNPEFKGDHNRSIPLSHFAPLASIPGVTLISLQKGPGTDQLVDSNNPFPALDFSAELDKSHGAFMDTAAIMKNLHLVITSDTAVAHLAGALAVPVWVALPFAADWRWLLDRSDSPWYPTMRLFRQPSPGNWQAAFEQISAALADLLQTRAP